MSKDVNISENASFLIKINVSLAKCVKISAHVKQLAYKILNPTLSTPKDAHTAAYAKKYVQKKLSNSKTTHLPIKKNQQAVESHPPRDCLDFDR